MIITPTRTKRIRTTGRNISLGNLHCHHGAAEKDMDSNMTDDPKDHATDPDEEKESAPWATATTASSTSRARAEEKAKGSPKDDGPTDKCSPTSLQSRLAKTSVKTEDLDSYIPQQITMITGPRRRSPKLELHIRSCLDLNHRRLMLFSSLRHHHRRQVVRQRHHEALQIGV